MDEVYPRRIPDVFVGRPVLITGRFNGKGHESIRISGRTGTEEHTYSVDVDLDDEGAQHSAMTRVWARSKIKDLSNREIVNSFARVKTEIVKTSIDYNLLSRYTAFLAVDTLARTKGSYGVSVNVAVPVPDGVRYDTTVQE